VFTFPFEKCARRTLPPQSRPLLAWCDRGGVRPRSHRARLVQLAEHTQGGARTEFGCMHAPLWAVRGASIFTFPFLAPAAEILALVGALCGRATVVGLVRCQRANSAPPPPMGH
jgi:hypothetical protein